MQTSANIKIGALTRTPAVVVNRNYVTLGIGSEVFAVDVKFVREILGLREIALLPKAPAFVIGVIDVRGNTVPVVDLRLKLGMEAAVSTDQTRIPKVLPVLIFRSNCFQQPYSSVKPHEGVRHPYIDCRPVLRRTQASDTGACG